MSYVTIEQAKAHLLVIHNADDVIIQLNIDAAEAHACGIMNRPRIEDNPVNPWKRNEGTEAEWLLTLDHCPRQPVVVSSEEQDPVPKSVVQAILLLTGDYYENRTVGVAGVSFTTNPAADNLLWFHRVGRGV